MVVPDVVAWNLRYMSLCLKPLFLCKNMNKYWIQARSYCSNESILWRITSTLQGHGFVWVILTSLCSNTLTYCSNAKCNHHFKSSKLQRDTTLLFTDIRQYCLVTTVSISIEIVILETTIKEDTKEETRHIINKRVWYHFSLVTKWVYYVWNMYMVSWPALNKKLFWYM